MGSAHHKNQQHLILHLTNTPVIPHPDSVCPIRARSLFDSVGSWIISKTSDRVVNRGYPRLSDFPDIFLR